jgi:hypothetical protein
MEAADGPTPALAGCLHTTRTVAAINLWCDQRAVAAQHTAAPAHARRRRVDNLYSGSRYEFLLAPLRRPRGESRVLSTSKVAAAGLASATTAVLGSYFGVLGTVGAAAATSVVSAVSSEVYQRSLDRTAHRLRSRGGERQRVVTEQRAVNEHRAVNEQRAVNEPDRTRRPARGSILPAMIFGSLLIFALGMALVSGVEYVRGAPLSGGSGGTSIGDVLHGKLSPSGALSSTSKDVPVVGDLLGTNQENNDSTRSNSTEHEQEKDREKPGLINGVLSGL